ncbi:MAG: translocation/assembly module TamB domain-containing protein [Candidatus Omnitrophota bacterium]
MFPGKKSFFLIAIATLVFISAGLACYFFFTTGGSSFITRAVLSNYVDSESLDIKKIDGSLSQTLIFEDIEFDDLKWLPAGSKLKIQKLQVYLASLSVGGLEVNIHNGRLNLPGSEAIFFYGNYQNSTLDLSVYSNAVAVRETLDLFTESQGLKNLSGVLSKIDINIKGSFLEPELNGEFYVDRLLREDFTMTSCPVSVSLQLRDIKEGLKLYGQILLKSAVVFGPKTAAINLQESKIFFNGVPMNPSFDLKGTSKVGDTKINIALKGAIDKPDLRLTSQPAMPEEWLLVMLATNKTWKGAGEAISKGELSADLAKDFLDYFLFSGSGNKIAQKFGLTGISIKYDGQAKGIGATKDISDKASASYSIEQPQSKEENSAATHKLGAEYKITESISVGVKKELKNSDKLEQTQDKPKPDDEIMLKFKKEF